MRRVKPGIGFADFNNVEVRVGSPRHHSRHIVPSPKLITPLPDQQAAKEYRPSTPDMGLTRVVTRTAHVTAAERLEQEDTLGRGAPQWLNAKTSGWLLGGYKAEVRQNRAPPPFLLLFPHIITLP